MGRRNCQAIIRKIPIVLTSLNMRNRNNGRAMGRKNLKNSHKIEKNTGKIIEIMRKRQI